MCCFALVVGSGLSTTIHFNVALVIFISCLLASIDGYTKRYTFTIYTPVVAAVAAVAASDKHESTNVKGHEHPSTLFCYLLYDDLYSDVNMTLRGIDLKPELESHTGKED